MFAAIRRASSLVSTRPGAQPATRKKKATKCGGLSCNKGPRPQKDAGANRSHSGRWHLAFLGQLPAL